MHIIFYSYYLYIQNQAFMELGKGWYHVIAGFVVIVWGVTFISTKVILLSGLSPEDIFFYRFLLAYIGIWFFGKHRLFADNLKDEIYFVFLGITGGSLYFLTENYAVQYTLPSNVSLLVCVAPLFTALLSIWFLKNEKISRSLVQGILIAFVGVALVVFNGQFILKLNPIGDVLSIAAAFCWAVYSILLTRVNNRYPNVFITRKVFFYGLLTILPFFYFKPLTINPEILFQPQVIGNILFLGVIASLLCYLFWNLTVKKLGAILTNNYIYIIPVITLITSAIIIQEKITVFAIVGTMLILAGVIRAGK
ncbi:membrane protein [Bacteroidia bacterium]|nr:membrane protein [Bacteroidia bacterium]GHT84856.1 membrane protein [Bacteroidia bacterium]GHU82278.1 membrane protein [Bacteroidia bacterium]